MKTLLAILIFGVVLNGCAFKSIDSCGAEGEGNGCTPISDNLQQAVDNSDARKAGGQPAINTQADYSEIDKALIIDEYSRVSPRAATPQYLAPSEVRIRIYPYSDGERFYDTRDIYILVQKTGWARGAVAYTPDGAVSLHKEHTIMPAALIVISDGLNIRTGPHALFESIGVLKKKTVIQPKQYRDGWYYVDAPMKNSTISGWVHSSYVQAKSED